MNSSMSYPEMNSSLMSNESWVSTFSLPTNYSQSSTGTERISHQKIYVNVLKFIWMLQKISSVPTQFVEFHHKTENYTLIMSPVQL